MTKHDDNLKHWGIKGMEWKHHKKKKKNNEDLKDRLRSLIKKAKSRTKRGVKVAKKIAKKAEHKGAPVVAKAEHKALKKIRALKKKAKVKWNGKPEKPKKPTSYSTDFVGDAKKRSIKAANEVSKKRTAEGHKELQRKATTLKKASEMEYWKSRTKSERSKMKDKAVNDHFTKVKKEKAARAASKDKAVNDYYKKVSKQEAVKKSNSVKKQKAVDKYWKDKSKKKYNAKSAKDFINKYGLKEFIKQEKVAFKSAGKGLKKDVKASLKDINRVRRNLKNSKSKREATMDNGIPLSSMRDVLKARNKDIQKSINKSTKKDKTHQKELSKVNGKIVEYGSVEKKIKRLQAEEAKKEARRRKISNNIEDAFKEVGIVKKTKTDRLNDALKEVGLKKKSTGEKIGETTNKVLKDLGLKKSKSQQLKESISNEAGLQYELAKAKAYQKTHNGELAPFDVTNKNQWRAIARSVGLTKSPAQKAAESITKKRKKIFSTTKKKTFNTYMKPYKE